MKKNLLVTMALFTLIFSGAAVAGSAFTAHCQGANEVPPVNSAGRCQAVFKATADNSGLRYTLVVTNLEFVTQAHIHMAPAGANGPVVAFLFGFIPEGDSENGKLAQGVLTSSDLLGPLAGQSIADLVAELESGNAYVNVHTQAHPPGEVRGQIQ